MKLHDDFTTLSWVKGELDETLKQARQALEAYVDDPADASLMRFCTTYLHQAQGTLRMVELYGAAMVIEEMERLADALLADGVRQRDEAYSVLMRGMVQLPDYLERVQSGHKDIPIVLLPLLNDLRACRGEKLLTESVLFSPDLSIPLPQAAAGVAEPLPLKDVRALALRLRLAFQAALLKWFRDSGALENPARLRDVLDRLRTTVAHGDEPRRLFWISAAVADAVSDGSLEPSAAIKLLFGGIDREIRRYAEFGEEGLTSAPPRELVQNLLYYIAHSGSHTPRVEAIRTTYRLGELLPTDQEVEHAKGSISGHNRTLLDTVSTAIKDDLLRVKESLDIFLRAQNRVPGDLLAQVDVLDRVRDTLGMLGLGVPRRVVTEQRGVVEEIATEKRAADEGTLLDVAGALLYVEASLDDHIERLGAAGGPEEDGALELPKAEVRKILDALMREAAINIQQAKHDVIAFIESPWDHARVEQIPRLLEEISGALRMLDLGAAAELMGGIVGFVEIELIRHRRVPTNEQMDKLADALASIEYYLEATREQRGGRERILDVTRSSLEALGYWPLRVDGDPRGPGGPGGGGSPAPAPVADTGGPAPAATAVPVASTAADDDLLAAAALAYGGTPAADEPVTPARDVPRLDTAVELPAAFLSWGDNIPLESGLLRLDDEPAGNTRVLDLDGLSFGDLPDVPPATVAAEPVREEPKLELDSAVEVAAGDDLRDLIVGDSVMPPAEEHDLGGLRLAETAEDAPRDVTAAEPVEAETEADADAESEEEWIEVEEEIEEEVEAPAEVGDGSFQIAASSEIDDEIRDVFVEEVQEEIDNLRAQLPLWQANADNAELLKPIRRSFHTLKGSGRLVGALALGEFSWKVENMLNRVLDHSIQPTPQVRALVEHAVGALPGLLGALRGEGAPTSDIAGIMATADRLAAGEMIWLPERVDAPVRKVKRVVTRRVRVTRPKPPVDDVVPTVPADADEFLAAVPQLEVSTSNEIVAGPLPGLDPVLFDILKSETAMHLSVVDDFLEQSRYVPLPVSEPVLRAVHTLSGAIAMVEINELSQVLAPLEGYLKRARAHAAPIEGEGIAVLGEAAELVRDIMQRLDAGSSQLPDSSALAARITALRDALDEPLSALQLYHQEEAAAADEAPALLLDLDEASPAAGDEDWLDLESAAAAIPSLGLASSQEADDEARAEDDDLAAFAKSLDAQLARFGLDDLVRPDAPAASQAVAEPAEDAEPVADAAGIEVEIVDPAEVLAADLAAEPVDAGDAFSAEADALADDIVAAPAGEAPAEPAVEVERDEDTGAPVDTGTPTEVIDLADLLDADDAIERIDADGSVEVIEVESPVAVVEDAAGASADAGVSAHVATQAEEEAELERELLASFDEPAATDEVAGDAADLDETAFTEEAFEEDATREALAGLDAEVAAALSDGDADDAAGETEVREAVADIDATVAEAQDEPVEASADDADGDDEPAAVPANDASAEVDEAPEAAIGQATPEAPAVPAAPPVRAFADDEQPEGRLELAEMDEDLLDIFVQEGNDILDHSDSVMAKLRETPHERELIGGLQRDLHTLKGGARMAGLAPIGDLSHVMESLLDAVYDGTYAMDRTAIESLEAGFDHLHGLVQRVAHRKAIAMPEAAIARLEQLLSGEVPVATATDESVKAASTPIPVAEASAAPASATPAAPARPEPRAMPGPEVDDEPRAPQEMIRVRSELLDSLVNYAGEVSIYRSRLEQQISTFRFNLIEFEQTVARLREQLRKLEIETEAQIIARYQREHHEGGSDATFDPLELDRFSQLQQYSRALGESVSDLVSIQGLLDDLTRQSETLLLQQSRVSSDLQEGLMRTRMVPFDSLVPSLRRTLRQSAQELGKRAQLKVEGAQGEMDRNLLERMKAPFEHMLRNALAHGIETPEQRLEADKPLDGSVTISVAREATEVVLRITDDGRGLNRDAIRRKAIQQGLLSPEAQLSDRDLYGFIMEAGFSTAEQVTQLAGRGVGMDVVHSEIKQLGGSLAIDSVPGKGTTFTIRLPFTLAVTQAILVRLGEAVYAVPMSSVQGVVRIAHDDYAKRIASGSPTYAYAGDEFTIYELSQLLGVPAGRVVDETQLPLLMTRAGDQRAAVRIDAVVGSREIVVKSVGPQISSVPGIFGATIMGDGSVVMILDLSPLVRRSAALRASVAAGEVEAPVVPVVPVIETRRNPLIMVVDDSITMRKVTTRVLERAEMEVLTAKDGLDAVEKLQDAVPDLMLLDIEMPRMDGYELATYMRNDSRLRKVPIIMVTSRTGEKHRQRALEIGVERYLGKPYQEVDLLRHVQETLRASRAEP